MPEARNPWTNPFLFCISAVAALLAGCAGGPVHQPDHAAAAVGFRSFWVLDPARTYRTAFDDGATYGAAKSPRPVLINTWYPAADDGPRMRHREYLQLEPDDPSIALLARKLMEYEHGVIAQDLVGSKQGEALDGARRALDRALDRVTPAVRDAAPASGRYPVVIYHGGAGSSIEDNALLCEALAGDGFVVIGSAFLAADGSSFNIDTENAGREIEFLLRVAAGMETVDLTRVGLVGHSAGAQGALIYAARPGVAVDAIVSLDTTQDYRTLADPRWPLLLSSLDHGRRAYTTPTMFVAGPQALFALGDTLSQSDRVYLTIPGLTHNEYISQGETAAAAAAEWKPDPDSKIATQAALVARRGARLRSLVVLYLGATLRDDRRARTELESLAHHDPGSEECTEFMGAGADQPGESAGPTTPRSVYRAYVLGGVQSAIAEMSRTDRLNPLLFDEGFAFQLMYDLAATDRLAEVPGLFDFFLERGIDARSFLVPQADFFASIKRYPEFVDGCVRLGRVIANGDPATLEMVRTHGTDR